MNIRAFHRTRHTDEYNHIPTVLDSPKVGPEHKNLPIIYKEYE